MPPKGFKTITVKEEVYGYFYKEWKKKKTELAAKEGITSFSGFVSHRLSQMIELEKKRIH